MEWLSESLEPTAVPVLFRYLLDVSLKGVLILFMAGMIAYALRRRSAATRHCIWFAAIISLLILPVLTASLPAWNVPLLPDPLQELGKQEASWVASSGATTLAYPAPVSAPQSVASPAPVPPPPAAPEPLPIPQAPTQVTVLQPEQAAIPQQAAAPLIAPTSVVPSGGGTPLLSGTSWSKRGASIMLMIWIAGMLLVLARQMIGHVGIWLLARKAMPLNDSEWQDLSDELGDRLFITRPVILLQHPAHTMPMTWGGLKPRVLLPLEANGWSEEKRRCVLLHELAHVKRWDCTTQALAQVAVAPFWFNPLAWTALKHLRVEREKACDDYVVSIGASPKNYASHLLDIARSLKASLTFSAGAVAMAKPSQLEGRVLAILDPLRRREGVRKATLLAAIVLTGLMMFPLSILSPWATATERTDATEEQAVLAPLEPIDVEVGLDLEKDISVAVSLGIENGLRRSIGVSNQVELADTVRDRKERVSLALIEALESEENPEVRANLVHTLGDLESEVSLEALGRVLGEDPDLEVRRMAIWALGEMSSPASIPQLLQAIDDEDTEVRSRVAWALGEIDDPAAVPALSRMLAIEKDPEVKRKLVWALGEIEDVAALEGLSEAMSDTDVEVRRMAAWALGELEDPRALTALLKATNDEDVEVRRKVAWALGESEDMLALEALSRFVKDEDEGVRSMAVRGLGELGSPLAVSALMELFKDESRDVRAKAAWALGEIESKEAVPGLLMMINDEDVEIRRQVVYALGEIGDPEAVVALIKALKDEDADVRGMAIWALGELGNAAAVDALSKVLQEDERAENRRQAAWSLGEIGDPRSLDVLTKALKDEHAEVRRTAAWALSELDL